MLNDLPNLAQLAFIPRRLREHRELGKASGEGLYFQEVRASIACEQARHERLRALSTNMSSAPRQNHG